MASAVSLPFVPREPTELRTCSLFFLAKTLLSQINISLNATKDVVVDNGVIPQLQNRFTFRAEGFEREVFILGREEVPFAVVVFGLVGFQLADSILVFDAQARGGIDLARVRLRGAIQEPLRRSSSAARARS